MPLIEFAPNPSGPAHVGTLRTYAVAWKLAKEQNKQISVRFDMVDYYNADISNASKSNFLNSLHELDIYPDVFIDNTCKYELDYIDESNLEIYQGYIVRDPAHNYDSMLTPGGIAIEITPDTKKRFSFRMIQIPTTIALLPYDIQQIKESNEWGYDVIMNNYPEMDNFYSNKSFRCSTYYFVHKAENNKWACSYLINSLISAKLRKVDTMVRGLNAGYRWYIIELPAAKYFDFNIYNQKLCAMVTCQDKKLQKSQLKWGDVGTIDWAISEFGVQKVKDDIFMSIEKDKSETIDIKTIFGG